MSAVREAQRIGKVKRKEPEERRAEQSGRIEGKPGR